MTNEKSKFKIAVIGIGGVGGFVGGKLAAGFADSDETEIVLVARGENERAIRENGLKIISTKGEEIIHPDLSAIEKYQRCRFDNSRDERIRSRKYDFIFQKIHRRKNFRFAASQRR